MTDPSAAEQRRAELSDASKAARIGDRGGRDQGRSDRGGITITTQPPHDPQTGYIALGIRAEHHPSGCAVECRKFDNRQQNLRAALTMLELLMEV
jgi:hypothetical protein